jgi:non-haem Fe2+, alpha-ketoglutarate-dependent halogenase
MSTSDSNPGTAALKESFGEHGFSFPCTAFSPHEAAEVLRGLRDYREKLRAFPSLKALDGAFKSYLLTPWLDRVVHRAAILDVVERLLGHDLLAWSVDIFVRSTAPSLHDPGRGTEAELGAMAPRGLTWHQDSPYLWLSPLDRIVRVWVALTAATLQNGTMRYLPGSHLRGECEHAYTEKEPAGALRGQRACLDIDEATAVPVELSPGEFSLHDIRTIHDSGENLTSQDRVSVAITYITRWFDEPRRAYAHGRDTGRSREDVRPAAQGSARRGSRAAPSSAERDRQRLDRSRTRGYP